MTAITPTVAETPTVRIAMMYTGVMILIANIAMTATTPKVAKILIVQIATIMTIMIATAKTVVMTPIALIVTRQLLLNPEHGRSHFSTLPTKEEKLYLQA